MHPQCLKPKRRTAPPHTSHLIPERCVRAVFSYRSRWYISPGERADYHRTFRSRDPNQLSHLINSY
eukprot:2146164-Prymnesium_polylepis.2